MSLHKSIVLGGCPGDKLQMHYLSTTLGANPILFMKVFKAKLLTLQRVSLSPISFVFLELNCSSEYTSVWAHKALDVFPTVVMFNYKGWPSKSEWFEVVIEFHR